MMTYWCYVAEKICLLGIKGTPGDLFLSFCIWTRCPFLVGINTTIYVRLKTCGVMMVSINILIC